MMDSEMTRNDESPTSSDNRKMLVFKKNIMGVETHKVILIVSVVLVIGFAIYAIFLRSSIISINIGANNTITNNIVTQQNVIPTTAPSTPKPDVTPAPSPAPSTVPPKVPETTSTEKLGFFQRIGAWFGWLLTSWLPQALVDVLKFIVVDLIWNILIKTVLWGILQFIWNLLVALWHAIFG